MNRRYAALALAGLLTFVSAHAVLSAPGATATGAPAYAHYYGPAETTFFPVDGCCFVLAGEPSIGVNWNTGATFFQHGFDTYRVAFDDATLTATWTEVTPPNSQFNVDPLLFTDSERGRTYAGGLDGACSIMSYTDDDGASWIPTGNACVATLDHQSIVSGPWRTQAGAPGSLAPHPRAVYYCAQASFVTCMTSLDGGLTFAAPSQVSCGFTNPGFHGSLHIGPKGHVYLPFKNCGGQIGVAVSASNGQGWLGRPIPGTVTPAAGFDPDVASTPSGWLYAGFGNGTGGAYASLTKTNGSTWTTPVDVGASLGIVNSTFHEMVAGDDDRAALAFLGTTTPGNAFAASFPGVWHLYVATTYDAGATWTTTQVTTDPVQRGWICAGGTGCSTGRNLLDFMDAQIDADGRVLVGYVDGCIGACAGPSGTAAQSTSAAAVITRQVSGKTLFAAFDGTAAALGVVAGGPYAGDVGTAIPLAGSASGGDGSYTYAWDVLDVPAGSIADGTSFSSPASATSTFTPDVVGEYTLQLTVTDGTLATASATASLFAGTTGGAPLITDASGDHLLPGTDIREADVVAETADTFTITLRVADLGATPSALNTLGTPWGVDVRHSVSFNYLEAPSNSVRYIVGASKYAVATPGNELSFSLRVSDAGNFQTGIDEIPGTWDEDADTITWIVPRAIMTVKAAPGAAGGGDMLSGSPPAAGDVLSGFTAEARPWVYALVGASFVISDSATGSGTYTFVS